MLSLLRGAKRAKRKGERGQALVEYILLLILVMSVILGALGQFNKGFRDYARNYFGEYLSCLLETGELPRLGNEREGVCDDSFRSFSLAEGRPPLNPASSNGGFDESINGAGRSANSANNIDATTGSPPSRGSEVTGGSSIPVGKFDPISSNTIGSGGASVPLSNADIKKDDSLSAGASRVGSIRETGSGGRSEDGRANFVPLNKRDGSAALANASTDEESASSRKGDRIPADLGTKIKKDVPESDFTLSFYLRLLLIILIIIAIVLFLGGQVLQFSKSREKGD